MRAFFAFPVKEHTAGLVTGGVLFLDELGEFAPSVLDSLRQPLEEGVIRKAPAPIKPDTARLASQRAARNADLVNPSQPGRGR